MACTPPPAAQAAVLERGRIVFSSDRTGTSEIFTMRPDGTGLRQLTDHPAYDSWWARVSPDRTRILFYRTPAGTHDTRYDRTSLWVMDADGNAPELLRPAGDEGWHFQGHAEWSPDGDRLVMFGGSQINPQIFVTDARGRNARQLTRRGGTNLDPSWSPDGRTIAFVGCPQTACRPSDYEIYTVLTQGGAATRRTHDALRDHDPYFSPDGDQVAWLTEAGFQRWGIRIAGADWGDRRWLINDGHINSYPSWSLDGELIRFHRLEKGERSGFSIFEIRPDGTGLSELTTDYEGMNDHPAH